MGVETWPGSELGARDGGIGGGQLPMWHVGQKLTTAYEANENSVQATFMMREGARSLGLRI